MRGSPRPVVVVSEPLDEGGLEFLAAHAEVRRATPETVADALADADALVVRTYTQVDEALLARAPRLKVVGRAGVALENIDVPACRARGVEVVHTPAANTLAVVDYTVRMIIELNRRFWPLRGYVPPEEFHRTRKQAFGRFLSGRTLGIVGAGRIGSRVGRAAVGLGLHVLTNDIVDVELDYPAEAVDKPALYARSDIVTLHVPLTKLTWHLVNAETLAQFRPGAQFINCARGPCVDYAALGEALRAGRIAAAAIDCHDPEPPPPDYPLFGLDNVILTPHVAARVPEAMRRMCEVVRDVVAVLEGRPPEYPAPDEPE
jgi:phosphoglycerate dehydrogenase-like enzyme